MAFSFSDSESFYLETVRKYLSEYKGRDVSGLHLDCSEPVLVNLYRSDGSYTCQLVQSKVSLEGISYIKLVGEGKLTYLRIAGFDGEDFDTSG